MKARVLPVALLAAAASFGAHATEFLSLWHTDGEFVDQGTVNATIAPGDGTRLDCGSGLGVQRSGNRIVVSARKAQAQQADCYLVSGPIGTLPVGSYEVEGRYYATDGTFYLSEVQSLRVLPLAGRCNRDPALQPSIIALHGMMNADQLADRVARDPAYAAKLGNPVVSGGLKIGQYSYSFLSYPPLVNPTEMSVLLHATGEFVSVGGNGHVCYSPPPPDGTAKFVEFYHAGLDHYFYTGDAGEIAAIEAGKVGPWTRTGKFFNAVTNPGCPFADDTVVYRFAGRPGSGPSSHFFTRDRTECGTVAKSSQWDFEGVPFWARAVAADGSCKAAGYASGARIPLYRVWRPFGDSNHRFTTDRAVVEAMVGKGWVDEGAAMCVLPSS
ncbi:MAG: hypothetical protein U1F41_04030 [Burkholderiales bacterium]